FELGGGSEPPAAGVAESRTTWRGALATWARSYREVLAAHPNVVPALARGSGRRPAQLHIADAVFGGLVDAGWPRREATSIGALMRSLVIGSALGSFAASFPADASVYEGVYPHLDQAHLLAERQREIDDRAFEVGLSAVLDGLEMRFAALRADTPGGARA
ncbi:TetR/AcrR family transcriptional regulator C-terminal domain-containing protein, partial [Catenulispora rubra]|uniref:TetR/AcrR family transcriptional regulator C-terminal domain-containing protein n=1 Tax=Catenulispora rubra TaxID=280293 RepID=UPI0018922C25